MRAEVDRLRFLSSTADNWYRADPNAPYTLVDVVEGVLDVISKVPQAGKIG